MSYNFENHFQLYAMSFDNWYEVGSFRRALAQIRVLDLSVQENRARALAALNAAVLAAPFDANRRFALGYYFVETQEPFRTALARIRQLVTARSRHTELGRAEVHAWAATSDVIKAGEEAMKVLWDASSTVDRLWTRARFEQSVPWEESAALDNHAPSTASSHSAIQEAGVDTAESGSVVPSQSFVQSTRKQFESK